MNNQPSDAKSLSWERSLLGFGFFLVIASLSFILLFGFLIRPIPRSFVWETLTSFIGLIVGGILIAAMLHRLRGKSSILPAGISVLCAVFLIVVAALWLFVAVIVRAFRIARKGKQE